jgi:hypothetical protein
MGALPKDMVVHSFHSFTFMVSDVIYDLYNYSAAVGYITSMLISCIFNIHYDVTLFMYIMTAKLNLYATNSVQHHHSGDANSG